MMRTLLRTVAVSLLALAGCDRAPVPTTAAPPTPTPTKTITVFAAASTTDVLREIGAKFESAAGVKVALSFDSSSNLAKQIKAGAPAEVFVSADEKWMDDVAAAGGIQPATRENLLGNELVLIAPAGKKFDVTFTKDFNFAEKLPQIKRIAVGDPAHVPAGRYAKQSLEKLGWWAPLEKLLVPAQDVRAALRLVELGEADAGIVYSTDAKSSARVVLVGTFPAETHEPVHYPVALCKTADPKAAEFLRFLRSAESTKVFENAGFRVLPAAVKAAP